MSFGTLNSTALNKRFLAGTIWLSAAALGISEAHADNNTLRFVDAQSSAYAEVEGDFRRILGYSYSTAIGGYAYNKAVINSGDYIINAIFIDGVGAESEAGVTDAGLRLASAFASASAKASSSATVYKESLLSDSANAVAYGSNDAAKTFTIDTRLVYVEGFALGRASARGLANTPAGRGAADATATAQGAATKTQFLRGAATPEAEIASNPYWVMAYREGMAATASSYAYIDKIVDNVREAYLFGTLEATCSVAGDPDRLAKAAAAAEAESVSAASCHKIQFMKGVGIAVADAAPLSVYNRHQAKSNTQAEGRASATGIRYKKPIASTEAVSLCEDAAQRLATAEAASEATSLVGDSAARLGMAYVSTEAEALIEADAIRLGNAKAEVIAESDGGTPDPVRYAYTFSDTGAEGVLVDAAARLAVSGGELNAEVGLEDDAVRLGVSRGESLLVSTARDDAVRLGKAAGEAGNEAESTGGFIAHRYLFATPEGNADAVDSAQRLAVVTASLDAEADSTAFATRGLFADNDSGLAESASSGVAERLVRFNAPVYSGEKPGVNRHPINDQALFSYGYRRTVQCWAASTGYARLNANMLGNAPRILVIDPSNRTYAIPSEDRTIRL